MYNKADYTIDADNFDILQDADRYRWAKLCIKISNLIIPVVIIIKTPFGLWPTAFAAYINYLLYGYFAIYFLKKGTLGSLIPMVAPIRVIVGDCIGVIFFSAFHPNGTYELLDGPISYLAGGVKYQAAIFLMLSIYFLTLVWLFRNELPGAQSPLKIDCSIAYISMIIFVPIVISHILLKIGAIPKFLETWPNRLFNYFHSLLFAAGVMFNRISKSAKIMMFVFLGGMVFFYTLGNSRGSAMRPIISLLCGLFLFSSMKGRTKLIIIASVMFLLPWYMLIGETTRALTGRRGFEDLDYKLSLMKEWKTAAQKTTVGVSFFGRMYHMAGNVLFARIPDQYPFRKYSPFIHFKEAVVFTLPGPIVHKFIKTKSLKKLIGADYTGNWMLSEYGLNVSETTSIETSFIGSLWMNGGFVLVGVGSFLLALMHKLVAWRISKAWVYRPEKALYYMAFMFLAIYAAFDVDLVYNWRQIVWSFAFAFFTYKFLVEPLLSVIKVQQSEVNETYQLNGE